MPRFSLSPSGVAAVRIASPPSASAAPSSPNKAWTRYRASDVLDGDTDESSSDDSDSSASTSSSNDDSSEDWEGYGSYRSTEDDGTGDDDDGMYMSSPSLSSYGQTRFSPNPPPRLRGAGRGGRSPRTPTNGGAPQSLGGRDSSAVTGEEKKDGDERAEAARLLRSLGRLHSPKPPKPGVASTFTPAAADRGTPAGDGGRGGGGDGRSYVGSFVRGYNIGYFTAPPRNNGAAPTPSDTAALLAHDRRSRVAGPPASVLDGGVDRISDLLRAATLVGESRIGMLTAAVAAPTTPASKATAKSADRLMALAEVARRDSAAIAQRMDLERRRYDAQQRSAAEALHSLIKADQDAARKVEERERRIREADEAEERDRLAAEHAEEERIERARSARAEEVRRVMEAREAKVAEDQQAVAAVRAEKERREAERKAVREAEGLKKKEHVLKAKKLVSKLAEVKASLEPFDKSKEVSRRRLDMKKVVRGKVNTLSHDLEKIRLVSAEVVRAINEQRTIDEETKKAIQAGQSIPHENARGKRYFLDMLSDNIIVRVQAEGFNGPRGDGFPLAGMLALVSVEAKDMVPLLAAHIYRACPTAIPTLPEVAEGESEDALMESLGMNKGKDGEYETFERFLQRTEGLVSIVADIMSSGPPNHSCMGGHKAALDWLERFLNLLAPAPHAPLPLVTAPVLVAFLTGAGHMLANKYPDQFRARLTTIIDDVSQRVDTGTVGQPSATRLKKALEGGFEGFRANLPPGAVPECYDGAPGTGQGSTVPLPDAPPPPPPRASSGASAGFGAQQQVGMQDGGMHGGGAMQGGMHGGGGGGSSKPPCRFFAQGTCRKGTNCNFSHDLPGGAPGATPTGAPAQTAPSPFGGGAAPAASANPFGGAAPASDGGMGAAAPNPFGGGAQPPQQQQQTQQMGAPSPFGGGGAAPPAASPFGGGAPAAPAPSPFGGGAAPAAAAPSPFGGGTPAAAAPSPFGGGGAAALAPTAFGGGGAAPAPSPFGGGVAAPAPSPFGGGGAAAAPMPFGGGGAAAAPMPFGGGGAAPAPAPAPTPFGGGGVAPVPTPFGGGALPAGGGGGGKPPCRFFAKGQCRNGANCQFSHGPPPAGGGGGGPPQGGGGKPPCRFFAQGKCRNGANCPFSHDAPGVGGGGGGGAFGGGGGAFGGGGGGGAMPPPPPFGGGAAPAPSPFGAPAGANSSPFGGGAAPAPSPFGGGGGGGGFGGGPFGGPRR